MSSPDLGVATAVQCDDEWLTVTLSNGREARTLLSDYPRLANATPAQRRNVRI